MKKSINKALSLTSLIGTLAYSGCQSQNKATLDLPPLAKYELIDAPTLSTNVKSDLVLMTFSVSNNIPVLERIAHERFANDPKYKLNPQSRGDNTNATPVSIATYDSKGRRQQTSLFYMEPASGAVYLPLDTNNPPYKIQLKWSGELSKKNY